MPRVGTDLILEANLRGDDKSAIGGTGKTLKEKHGPFLQEVIRDVLYGGGDTRINMTVRRVPGGDTRREPFHLVSGHLWGYDPDGPSAGPMPANIMVIGKNIGDEELSHRRLQRGPSGRFLLEALHKLGASPGDWYVTNVLKTVHLDGDRGALKAYWIENQRHLLHQEFRLVRPKFVLLLGADAVKSVLGKDMSLGKMEGRVVELTIPITKTETHTMLVMACLHPAAVQSTVELTDKFYRSLSRFLQLTRGQRWDQEEPDLDHRVVRTEPELLALLEEANAQCSQEGFGKLIGLDAEWHGEHPQNRNAYLRTVQISWAYKKAAVIVVHEAGGKEVGFSAWARDAAGRCLFDESGQPVLTKQDSLARLYAILREFFADKRLVGHQLCADAEVLLAAGVDLRSAMQVPDDWRRCKWEGPLDTSLMAHAVDETDDFTLTGQTLRRTDAPRYDLTLQKWKERYCSQNGLKPSQLDGYGDCPDEILYPYGAYDADVTRRVCLQLIPQLDRDVFGNNCWKAYWLSAIALRPVLEIDTTGLLLDRQRVDDLVMVYMEARSRLASQILTWSRWPTLKLSSRFHVAELLFGERYNGHGKQPDGQYRRLRPEGARIVGTLPVLTTDKRPKPWDEVMQAGKEDEYTAATNKQVLGMLLHDSKHLRVQRDGKWVEEDCSEIIGAIRDYRFISQVLKSVLREPLRDEEDEEAFVVDDDDMYQYGAGVPGAMCDDYRVRTFISQLKETGRWASARPPLQNFSNRREADYKRILGKQYRWPLRSIFCADTDYVIVEADYTGAELYGMAIMSGDERMIRDAQRNLLPEDSPDYYDIHSNVARLAFGLECEPTKAGLAAVGKKHLRIVAKSVIFGVAYGRGAKAIAIAAREEGVEITELEAQAVIDAIFQMYPGLETFFAECRRRAVTPRDSREPSPRWICGPFGRYRRFPEATDFKTAGDMERQAQNFPKRTGEVKRGELRESRRCSGNEFPIQSVVTGGNPEPSRGSDSAEGATTSSRVSSRRDSNAATSAPATNWSYEIV